MEKITLSPGVWTPFTYSRFQVSGQNSVRIAFGTGTGAVNGGTFDAPAAGAAYITTLDYDPKMIDVGKLLDIAMPSSYVYLMPDADAAVDIVAL